MFEKPRNVRPLYHLNIIMFKKCLHLLLISVYSQKTCKTFKTQNPKSVVILKLKLLKSVLGHLN